MILGRISGKTTTNKFSFIAESSVKKFDYLQVAHKDYGFVLCQILELERTQETLCKCQVIGYLENELLKTIRIPFSPGSEVLKAENKLIKQILGSEKGAYIGKLEGKDITVNLNLRKLLTKHLAVLAKSGAGKSYTVGVILEEILEQKIPLVIIDPHGEYSSLAEKNNDSKDNEKMAVFNVQPKSYKTKEYGDTTVLQNVYPIKISNHISQSELDHLIPGKLNATQLGMMYSAMKTTNKMDFDSLILELEAEESSSKWTLINILKGLKNTKIFSDNPTSLNDLVKSGSASIINMKGIPPEFQEIITYKLLNDMFEARKKNKIPPFFCVIEEAHNFCPERSFGEAKSSKIIRTIASEGRKFGLGLCVISQRPARVEKSVLSQCTTQIILKVTNPNDLKALSNSIEGLTLEAESEIKNLPIGTALLTGISEMPLLVNIRPRRTRHGGTAIDILNQPEEKDIYEQMEDFEEQELIPVIKPKITPNDIKLMEETPIEITTKLVPCKLLTCKTNNEFEILIDLTTGKVVVDVETNKQKKLPDLQNLTSKEITILQAGFLLKEFNHSNLSAQLKSSLDLNIEVNSLVQKGYFLRGNNKFKISEEYLLSRLENASCPYQVNYEKLYGEKLQEKQSIDVIKEKVSKFADVMDIKETFLVVYEILRKH